MKRIVAVIGALLLFAALASAQLPPSIAAFGGNYGQQHRVGTIFFAPGYATWQATMISGNSASGSQTVIIADSSTGVTLGDGTTLPFATVFNTSTPITILDANVETVTPSGVSISTCPAGFLGVGGSQTCAFVTASFSNTHGANAVVLSGDAGIFEALTDAGNQGGGLVYWAVDTGIVTLNTGALTTTTTTKVPTNRSSIGCAARVTTTITTSANWAVGSTASGSSFCSANSTLTAGTTGIANQIAPTSLGTTQALEAVVFTMGTSNPGAGAIKARVWGWTPVQPAN
jgi:hypothetical protein